MLSVVCQSVVCGRLYSRNFVREIMIVLSGKQLDKIYTTLFLRCYYSEIINLKRLYGYFEMNFKLLI